MRMKPNECNSRDWPLYFHNTYMMHDTIGLVLVSCDEGTMLVRDGGRSEYQSVESNTLSPVWPDARAINYRGHAAYVGRRARREARRSATTYHYPVVWSARWGSGLSFNMFKELVNPSPYPPIAEALDNIATGELLSVAISRDIILNRFSSGEIGISFQGIEAGLLREENGRYSYMAEVSTSPIARRVHFKLQKEGVLSHSLTT